MQIETRFNIGDEVWTIDLAIYKPSKYKILGIHIYVNGVPEYVGMGENVRGITTTGNTILGSVVHEYLIDFGHKDKRFVIEDSLFKTKQDLLNRMNQ